jgi:hypothetical protein
MPTTAKGGVCRNIPRKAFTNGRSYLFSRCMLYSRICKGRPQSLLDSVC